MAKGIHTGIIELDENGNYGGKAVPNGAAIRASTEQRYGMKVTFDSVNKVTLIA
mgnify:CR=1 FL=1